MLIKLIFRIYLEVLNLREKVKIVLFYNSFPDKTSVIKN